MATERQIEANRRNAARSTGPRTEAGKARSRLNATRHGLAGESVAVEAQRSALFESRRDQWAPLCSIGGDAAQWALDRAVAASIRIERCERVVDGAIAAHSERARLAWDQDRAVEAASRMSRLSRDPCLIARQLETTRQGVDLLIDRWEGLLSSLDDHDDWTESEAALALDLLGTPTELRSGVTRIDDPDQSQPGAFRRDLALDEIARLEELLAEVLDPLDDLDRRQAMAGDVALLAQPARLALRYEREAWARYRSSMQQLTGSKPIEPVAPTPAPASAFVPEPEPEPEPTPEPAARRVEPPRVEEAELSDAAIEEGRRFSREIVAMIRSGTIAVDLGELDDRDDFEDLDRPAAESPAHRNEPNRPGRSDQEKPGYVDG